MKLTVVTLNGQSFKVESRGDTVEDLKVAIAERRRIQFDQIRLIFKGSPIADGGCLSSYGIQNGGTVHLVVSDVTTMRIAVRLPDGKNVTLDVQPSEEVKSVKAMVQTKWGYQADNQELIHDGRVLQEGRLRHYNINNGATLVLKMKDFNIFVTTLSQERISLTVSPTETVESLKKRLYQKTKVVVGQQRLIYNGKELNTGRLSDYGVIADCIINMVGRLRGG